MPTSNYSSYAALSSTNSKPTMPEPQAESSKLINITSAEQRQQLLNDPVKKLTIIDNYTSWCGPCRAIAPKYSAMAEKFGDLVNFCKEDAEKGIPGGKTVDSVPVFFYYFEGKFIDEMTVYGADITEVYNNMMKFMKVKENAGNATEKQQSAEQTTETPTKKET